LNGNWEMGRNERESGAGDAPGRIANANGEKDFQKTNFSDSNSKQRTNSNSQVAANYNFQRNAYGHPMSAKELALAKELRVGQGPVCGPGRVRAEVLERDRQRQAAHAKARSG